MLYTLYYQKRYGDTVVIARSKSLLKLLKVKMVTFGFGSRAHVTADHEEFDKFDLSPENRIRFNDFEMKANSGYYFSTYDYSQRVNELTR